MQLTRSKQALGWPAAAILFVLMLLNIQFFVLNLGAGDSLQTAASWIYALYLSVLFAGMMFTGHIARYRRIFFIVFALLFFPSFIMNLIESRGSMGLSEADIVNTETPFCHIVIPITLIQAALSGTVIFPARLSGHYASIYSMLTIWLAASLLLGRGWCSWVCFYGGWEEGFSRIAKKKRLNIDRPKPQLRYFNQAMLLFVVLVSLVTFSSIYCEWFCPFKLVTEYAEVTGLASYIATILFICLFFGLVVVLPFLTKKRFQCAVFCPFGAFQSHVDRISPYRIRIDHEKCINCGACVRACPTLSLPDEVFTEKRPFPMSSCTKCGECIEVCPKGAISYGFRHGGKKPSRQIPEKKPDRKRSRAASFVLGVLKDLVSPQALLPFTAFTFGVIISSGFGSQSIYFLLKLLTGGSL